MIGSKPTRYGRAPDNPLLPGLFDGAAIDPAQVFRCDATCLAAAITRLPQEDALSLSLLTEAARLSLLDATDSLTFRPARPQVGEGEKAVLQDFDICMTIPVDSPLSRFAQIFETLTNEALALVDPTLIEPAHCPPLRYNNLVVQRYHPAPFGITPHRDHICYQGLVSLLILGGDGRFLMTADRAGNQPREIPSPPGSLVLMRGAGFAGLKSRPFHQLRDIETGRVSFGLRYDAHAEAASQNEREATSQREVPQREVSR